MKFKHASLFSGIGGFDLAAEWMGWENVFHCEWMPFPRQVLSYHFPKSISYENIITTDFTIHRGSIDILTGGFPCQPYSLAGKRLGKEDERHLWPQMLRAIREIEPTFVVGENVRGLVNWNGGMVFDEVQADLENAGYEVISVMVPACAVGAPHRRDRIWFVAKNIQRDGCVQREFKQKGTADGEQRNISTGGADGICVSQGLSSHALSLRLQQREDTGEMGRGQTEICGEGNQSANGIEANGKVSNTSDTNSIGLEGRVRQNGREREVSTLNALSSRGTWQNFPTQPPICGGDDGLPTELDGITFSKWRKESIKGYGNAIVPQVAFEIFKAIENSVKEIKNS
jgi:DNA (cytosine-5)-methyltransferase 1